MGLVTDLIKAGARIWDDKRRQKEEDEQAALQTEEQLVHDANQGSKLMRTRTRIAAEKELKVRRERDADLESDAAT